jgi:hypothetical protein
VSGAGIGAALSDKSARVFWQELRVLYEQTDNATVRDRLAAALSNCARREHFEDLLGFVGDAHLGESRVYFLRPISRIGNRIEPGQGRAMIVSLADDPVLGREAFAILKRKGRNS